MNPDPFQWTGGWVHAYAGLRFDLDPAQPAGRRAAAVQVERAGHWQDLDEHDRYRYAGYWFPAEPERVGGIRARGPVEVLRGADGTPRDVTELVAEYLVEHDADAEDPRIRLVRPLPAPVGPNPELQPLRGVDTIPPRV